MSIPLYSLLILYAIVIFIYIVFSLISLYHIVRTASFTTIGFLATFFVLTAGVLTIYGSWYLLQDVNWSSSLSLFSSDSFSGAPTDVLDF